MVGDVGDFLDLHQLAYAQRAAGQLVYPGQARQIHLAAELIERRGRQVVRLVNDQQAVVQLGQEARANGGQQQVMVGDDDLGRHQLLAPLEVAALAEKRAMLAGAGAGLGRHRAPHLGLGRGVEQVAVAVPAALGQRVGHAGVELHARLGVVARAFGSLGGGLLGEQVVVGQIVLAAAAAGQALQLELADIAPAPLGQGEGKGLLHARGKLRQILVYQLLLQRHGGGGDQHPRAARQRQAMAGTL